MNSFQTACRRSHLLLRPGVGKRARDVFVRVVGGRGGGGEQEESGWRRGQRVFPALGGAGDAPSLLSSRALWVGSGFLARLTAEEVVWN